VDLRAARGDVPFYQLPYIELRGIPALRYQGDETAVIEAELRWNATPRWAIVAFAGTGHAEESASAWGAGFRYLVARAPRHLHGRRHRARARGNCVLHPGGERLAVIEL
jgi:hypothetical protein